MPLINTLPFRVFTPSPGGSDDAIQLYAGTPPVPVNMNPTKVCISMQVVPGGWRKKQFGYDPPHPATFGTHGVQTKCTGIPAKLHFSFCVVVEPYADPTVPGGGAPDVIASGAVAATVIEPVPVMEGVTASLAVTNTPYKYCWLHKPTTQ